MSSPKPPIHPTRQQLDELEALLQRMLALPVNQLEGEASDVSLPTLAPIDMPPDWESSEPAVLSTEAARQARENGTPANGSASDRTATAQADRPEPSADSPRWPESAAEENLGTPATNLTIVARPASGERPWVLPAAARRIPWPLRPLVWSNRAFDRCAGHLGSPGRWLRGPRGRTLIGWSGIALVTTAAAWAWLEWMGWTW